MNGINKRVWLLIIGLFGFLTISYPQSTKIFVPKSYIAYKATGKILVDGLANEDSWKKTPWTDDFIDIQGVLNPKYKTHVKILWDNDYLYFYAELEEPNIWGDITKRDAVIFYNNDFEVFIDPTGDTHNYYEFEMNALNTVWDLFLTKPYRDYGIVLNNWDINGLKTAVHIYGTINNPSDIDKKWSLEIAMPWKVLTEASNLRNQLPINKAWRINFSRVNWNFDIVDGKYHRKKYNNSEKYLPEYNWVWSPQGVINMHEPEKWGYVYFSSKEAGKTDTFRIPKDEKIKWIMYKLYRAQKKYFEANKHWSSTISNLIKSKLIVDNKTLIPKLEISRTGWNIIIKSPFSNKLLIIKEDGKFITN